MERGQTGMRAFRGSDRIIDSAILMEWFWEKSAREGESPVHERRADMAGSRVPRDTWNLVGTSGDHPVSLNTP